MCLAVAAATTERRLIAAPWFYQVIIWRI